MADVQDLSEVRKKYKKKSFLKRVILLFLLLLVVLGGLSLTNETVRQKVSDVVDTALRQFGGGNGYPVSLAGATPSELVAFSGTLGVVTETNYYIYNSSGKEVGNIKHGLTNPKVAANGGTSVLYDRGGKKVVLSSKTRQLLEKSFDHAILTADMGPNGILAVATASQRYTSQLMVYDGDEKSLLNWYSAETHIVGVSVFPDGKGVAVGTLSAQDGALKSTVVLLSFSSEEPLATVDFPGEAVYAVKARGSDVFVITDKAARTLNKKGEVIAAYSYNANNLVSFSLEGDKHMVLVFGDHNQYQQAHLVMLGTDCQVKGEATLPEAVKDLSVSGEKVAVLLQQKAALYSMKGELIREMEVEYNTTHIRMVGANAYVCAPGVLLKL